MLKIKKGQHLKNEVLLITSILIEPGLVDEPLDLQSVDDVNLVPRFVDVSLVAKHQNGFALRKKSDIFLAFFYVNNYKTFFVRHWSQKADKLSFHSKLWSWVL